ncbi:MAG TPA: hypothetical protein VND20_05775 [Candidatus Binataceae bacterium]|nr:hypothetical protein [Candidatus Binataceae bacterium]
MKTKLMATANKLGFAVLAVMIATAISAGSAGAGVLGLLNQFGVSPNSAAPSTSAVSPLIAAPSAITPFNGRGNVVYNPTASVPGSCADSVLPCNTTTCECDNFSGPVTVPSLGKSTLVLNITTANTSSVQNGTGECLPGTGHGTICNNTSCMGIFVAGSICTGIVSETSPTTGKVALGANENYLIDPDTSTGSVAGASGGGSLQISNDISVVSSVISSINGYASINGVFQKHP